MPEPPDLDLLGHGAALVSHVKRCTIRVSGADRAEWLQGLLTNDVQSLRTGQGCYAAWLTPQGRMVTDAVVLAEGDTLSVEVPVALGESVHRRLSAAIFAEDVQLADESGFWATIGVHGPVAAETIARAIVGIPLASQRLTGASLAAWPEYSNAPVGPDGLVMRLDHYGAPGFVMRMPVDARDLWASRLRLAGATSVASEVVEFARIEAGRPEFLVDMDADTIPLEAGIEARAISFTKGCYVGQEVIVRIVHRGGGRVAKKLVGLRCETTSMVMARSAVAGARGEIGRVTSAAWSPRAQCTVALAYVHRDYAVAGTTVTVDCDEGSVPALVCAFPVT